MTCGQACDCCAKPCWELAFPDSRARCTQSMPTSLSRKPIPGGQQPQHTSVLILGLGLGGLGGGGGIGAGGEGSGDGSGSGSGAGSGLGSDPGSDGGWGGGGVGGGGGGRLYTQLPTLHFMPSEDT